MTQLEYCKKDYPSCYMIKSCLTQWQNQLNYLYPPVKITGVFDDNTLKAFNKFREDYGLESVSYINGDDYLFLANVYINEILANDKSRAEKAYNEYVKGVSYLEGIPTSYYPIYQSDITKTNYKADIEGIADFKAKYGDIIKKKLMIGVLVKMF